MCAGLVACGTAVPELTPTPLKGYRVVYRVTAPGVRRTYESLRVRRPYDGRVDVLEGPTGPIRNGRATSRAHFWQLGKDGVPRFGVVRAPGGPARDAWLSALHDAVRAGRAEAIGSDRVLGRRCLWFAYRDPAPEVLAKATDDNRVESCVDGSGIVLREVWTLDGRPARIAEAISVSREASPKRWFFEGRDPKTEKVTEPKGAEFLETNTVVRDVAAGRIGSPFAFDPPTGWKRDRVALVGSTAGSGSRPTQYLARTYVRDEQLVVIDTASGAEFTPPWDTDEGTRTEIGVGEGRIVFFADRVEVRLLSRLGFARVVAPSREIALDFIRGLGAGR